MQFYKLTTNLCDIKLRECIFFNNMFKSILFNKWNIFLYYTNETHNISFELQICKNANSPENCIYDAIFTIERAPPPFTNDGKKHWLFIFLWNAVNFKSKNKNIITTMSILPTKPRNGYTYTYDHHQWPIAHWPVVASWPPHTESKYFSPASALLQPYTWAQNFISEQLCINMKIW